jgi:2-isopropylmalate synthase
LKLKKTCVPAKSLPKLKELSQFVDEIANSRHNPRQPWVGSAAFAHKGGMHVNAVQKLTSSYEHIDPALVGNARTVLVSDLSGRSNIVMKAQELGFKLTNDTPELKQILHRVKELENQGYEFEAAEASLALLIRAALDKTFVPRFNIETYHVSMRRDKAASICEATVKVCVGKTVHHEVAEGDGPVNALDKALRNALVKSFPELKKVVLTDYKVRILDSKSKAVAKEALQVVKGRGDFMLEPVMRDFNRAASEGTAAKTRVLIESTDGKREWGTVGVNENIIEASLQALVDSMEYALLKK